ncbi:MAG: DUF6465 family protein [Anaerosacchariphilus sp.]
MAAKKTTQTTKKAEDVKINAPVKTVETVKTETVAPAVKAEVKETVKEAPKAEVKAEAVKAEKKAEVKAAPKKRGPKPKTEKTEKKEAVQNVYVQFAGKEILTADLVAQVTEKWVALGHRASSIKELNLYVKPEDSAAYYVINGKESGKIEL